jgi:hypothetical protein
MTHLYTVLLKIKRQSPNLLMKILRVYINGPVIGELRLMQPNIFILFKTSFSMSLMNNRNKKGPRVDHWGTPALTVFHLEKYPSIFTLCFLS